MTKSAVIAFAFLSLCFGLEELNIDPERIPVAIEWDRSIVQSENRSTPDIADIQNVEGDPEHFIPECGTTVKYLEDPRNCGRYYQCSNGIPYQMYCPSGLYFDIRAKLCDWPHKVNCAQDRYDRRRIGRLSDVEDGAQSTVQCPEGYVPVSCASSDYRRSEGTYILGRNCSAVNGKRGRGQRAIVSCVRSGNNDYKVVSSGDWEREPSAICPQSYRLIGCLLRNPWNDIRFAFPSMYFPGNKCMSDITCLAGWGCSVQAVCRRI